METGQARSGLTKKRPDLGFQNDVWVWPVAFFKKKFRPVAWPGLLRLGLFRPVLSLLRKQAESGLKAEQGQKAETGQTTLNKPKY